MHLLCPACLINDHSVSSIHFFKVYSNCLFVLTGLLCINIKKKISQCADKILSEKETPVLLFYCLVQDDILLSLEFWVKKQILMSMWNAGLIIWCVTDVSVSQKCLSKSAMLSHFVWSLLYTEGTAQKYTLVNTTLLQFKTYTIRYYKCTRTLTFLEHFKMK